MIRRAPVRRALAGLLDDWLRLVLVVIGAVTVLSGLGQLVVPGLVLDVLSGASTATSRHLFAIVGMFMVVVGGLLVHGLLSPPTPAYVVLWAGLQKLGAFAAVGLGVARDLFASVALLVAVFDLATAVLCGVLWWRLSRRAHGVPAGAAVA
ncbi:MAG TPA: hypothetical protein VFJ14_03115 [Nocardioidaceae bacterium]|nr:hypothetical protein [Nocardioidaceae bacterium]